MIHPAAVIADDVTLGENVQIAPYAVIDGPTSIGDGCRIGPHVHIGSYTTIGAGTKIHKSAVVGDEPQDVSFSGEESYTRIGSNCVIREFVTIHRGTDPGTSTVIGDNCMFMAFTHIAHNCQIADNVVCANNCQIAGHVHIGYRAFLSANVGLHQFCHVGEMAMVTGLRVLKDIVPYCLVDTDNTVVGPNVVGLRRAGFNADERSAVKQMLKTLFYSGYKLDEAVAHIEAEYPDLDQARTMVEFVRHAKRGLCPGKKKA